MANLGNVSRTVTSQEIELSSTIEGALGMGDLDMSRRVIPQSEGGGGGGTKVLVFVE